MPGPLLCVISLLRPRGLIIRLPPLMSGGYTAGPEITIEVSISRVNQFAFTLRAQFLVDPPPTSSTVGPGSKKMVGRWTSTPEWKSVIRSLTAVLQLAVVSTCQFGQYRTYSIDSSRVERHLTYLLLYSQNPDKESEASGLV